MNKTLYLIIAFILSVVFPIAVPFFQLWSGRHTFKGDYAGYGAGPYLLGATIIIFVLSLFLWIPGMIAAMIAVTFMECQYKDEYHGY
jgi:hypothetical protein